MLVIVWIWKTQIAIWNYLIFFLQQKATFLQVVLAISKSQSNAGFRV